MHMRLLIAQVAERNQLMSGIDFIGPDANSLKGPRADEISHWSTLPRVYGSENLLSEHLSAACFWVVLELTALQHVNPVTGEAFGCVSYYSDDQKDGAVCSKEDFGYVATMSLPLVRRLVKIANRLAPAMDLRPRQSSDGKLKTPEGVLQVDQELNALLDGSVEVSEPEALRIMEKWPSTQWGAQIELGDYALFYDMIRLIWVHEWAHALCGHVALAQGDLGISRLHEWSAERVDVKSTADGPRFRRNEVMQALELHADQFAVKWCIGTILEGNDPIAYMAGPRQDLVDRLLIFNIACCIFAILWSLAERRYACDNPFWPPAQAPTSNAPSPLFVTTRSTHPPAVLRYARFRGYQRAITTTYGMKNGYPHLGLLVDTCSFEFLGTLAMISRYFVPLQSVTPMMVRTPAEKTLEAYSAYLDEISQSLTPRIETLYYLPTK